MNNQDYLEKTFLEELNYKIWSTKGARFHAHSRLKRLSKISGLCNSLISVYLTAAGLLSVYNIYNSQWISESVTAYSVTCLSILALVFGQIESAKDFNVKAKEFHACGLELSELYNELRIFKTLRPNATDPEKEEFAKYSSGKYQRILEKYDNHLPIDNSRFKATKPDYHNMSSFDVFRAWFNYHVSTFFIYYFLIVIPPLVIIIFFVRT
ncbi:SLATT domain-containing protein [uncultured Pedobacter sp.]|uniref:SLATT domain-containing protein n=1 Tax=uncultured Pedobacter sp. TaxID=246139 RepID=UPI0025E205EA|nr:SLATT domain-containing protein [uncultured Pedobacter sp.]